MTPDLATLRDLQSRVRKAKGPDRELDASLHWFLLGQFLKTDDCWRPRFDADPAAAWDVFWGREWRGSERCVPYLTASIDSAVSLADQFGIVFEIARHPWEERNEFYAKIHLRMPEKNGRISLVKNNSATTRPLAVLVSLLDNLIAKLELDEHDAKAEHAQASPVAETAAISQSEDRP